MRFDGRPLPRQHALGESLKPRNAQRQGARAHKITHRPVNSFTIVCALPAQNAGRGGTSDDPTTREANTGVAYDRLGGYPRITGDHRGRTLDCERTRAGFPNAPLNVPDGRRRDLERNRQRQ